ncbi:bifunctional 3,4-dihydroxy-2-butanone-4-phosphate synthase/GTP cyclohydrolase II [Nocardia brasiliensis]|uniref:bifunctional 3,4-dihydroxy-2-butanone-4-phosphate synthase/GTP cyclohydrolase II n=1 Tax=Nocardia brasiliensis TaxID=37326 RepID=UPI003D9030B2
MTLDLIEDALRDFGAGRPVVVLDDEGRENEGDLILAGAFATAETIGMMVRHGSGVICVALPGRTLDRLRIPPMIQHNEDPKGTAFTVSVDARHGVSTGISAADRAETIRVLTDPLSRPEDLNRPGHVFPLRGVPGGVLRRPGHTEASLDLAQLAGVSAAGVLCELVNDDGSVMRRPGLEAFARGHGLSIVSIADLIEYRWRSDVLVEQVAQTVLPTIYGDFRAIGYRSTVDGKEIDGIALVMGNCHVSTDVLVRIHSECLTGDVLASVRCDCGEQLGAAMRRIAAEGRGVLIYLRGHEGRGIGLVHKLQAYGLQDGGIDTVNANLELGLPVDARHYGIGAQILRELGVGPVRLLTNNPGKQTALTDLGVAVSAREPLQVPVRPTNLAYLRTKRDRLGHLLTDLDDQPPRSAR